MDYTERLFTALKNTSITDSEGKIYEYEPGFKLLFDCLSDVKERRSGLFMCGNGGSAGIALHMTADYLKNGGFNVRSLYNASVLTCLGNDLGYEDIFCKQLELMAIRGDTLIVISSSGNSENILRAVDTMERLGGEIVTFTGFRADNPARKRGKYNVYTPEEHYGIVESIHNLILQRLVDEIVERDGVALDKRGTAITSAENNTGILK